ncbi:MAG TPA: hypothetical protein ENI33_01020 [Thermoplasmatales archaeon]|nr:hypothetical protein [Thermoplasmatales archaeon]
MPRARSQIFLSLSVPHFHSSLFHILSPYANLFQHTACSSPSFYGLRAYTPFSCGGFTCYLKYICSLFKGKIFIILDNLSSHKTKKVKEWCEKNDTELVFTPTNASWLNRIECHLTALKKFTIRNSNYKDFKEMGSAIRKYIRWRNKNYEKYEIKKIENKHNFL